MLSLIQQTLLRSVPGIGNPQSLVTVEFKLEGNSIQIPAPAAKGLLDRSREFEWLVIDDGYVDLNVGGDPAQALRGALVTSGYFSSLGVRVKNGREFSRDEVWKEGSPPVAVVSSRLANRLSKVREQPGGSMIRLNGKPVNVVGIVEEGFHGLSLDANIDVWMPLAQLRIPTPYLSPGRLEDPREGLIWTLVGRLTPGRTPETAGSELTRLLQPLVTEMIEARQNAVGTDEAGRRPKVRAEVFPGSAFSREERSGLQRTLALFSLAAAFVMLISCANASGLMLSRNLMRQGEFALRLSLGASRWRVAASVLGECVLLSLGVAVGALAFAFGALASISGSTFFSHGVLIPSFRVDLWSFASALAISALACTLSGLAPALSALSRDPARVLSKKSRSFAGGLAGRNSLAGLQLAIALPLMVTAGLFLKSLDNYYSVDLGMQAAQVQSFTVDPSAHEYSPEDRRSFYRRLHVGLRGSGELNTSVMVRNAPFSRRITATRIRPAAAGEGADWTNARYNLVTPGYFDSLQIPILQGRDFREGEALLREAESPFVAILPESLARTIVPDGSPVGRRVELLGWRETFEVIGVVADHRSGSLFREPTPIYLPFGQGFAPGTATLLARSKQPLAENEKRLQALLQSIDPNLALTDVRYLSRSIDEWLATERLQAQVIPVFALLALVLAAVGLYGTLSWAVQQRTREIGIRTALGAARRDIGRMIARRMLPILAFGGAAGCMGAYLSWRLISRWLFVDTFFDPFLLAATAAVLCASVAIAVWKPVLNATRVDPVRTLRFE